MTLKPSVCLALTSTTLFQSPPSLLLSLPSLPWFVKSSLYLSSAKPQFTNSSKPGTAFSTRLPSNSLLSFFGPFATPSMLHPIFRFCTFQFSFTSYIRTYLSHAPAKLIFPSSLYTSLCCIRCFSAYSKFTWFRTSAKSIIRDHNCGLSTWLQKVSQRSTLL